MHYAPGLHFLKHFALFLKLYLLLVSSNSKLDVSQEEIRLKSRLAMFVLFFLRGLRKLFVIYGFTSTRKASVPV
jgi:hypothetical protein